ncbi:uncharacterized protein K489DRAFT_303791, partial [Dissoconium aciculare CBS 342.82]|uniref:HSF-type DNA-binding domain-containing protein n=1 Tax=Dissoconium aciculare CBS 342.82 TaxID=1314786 RepID=A0A6J3MFZ8_9PEZI
RRDPFSNEQGGYTPKMSKHLPMLGTVSGVEEGDPMDMSQSSGIPVNPPTSSPEGDHAGDMLHSGPGELQVPHTNGTSMPAGAAATQPKIVQTAFIHKLYNMLEDQSIQHLISWSVSNESFVMSPSSEFARVLAQYFKHTNISSFVRQLNMYGFHKVSDVFHSASPDAPLWEFKHGQGSFKRGDLAGLREIKRRASRQTLIHRDSFSAGPKIPPPQPAGAPMETIQEPIENRVHALEWNTQEMSARLMRSEEAFLAMAGKCQALLDGLIRCHQWNQDLSGHLLNLVPDQENPVHREVQAVRQAISRQIDSLRSLEEPPESMLNNRHTLFTPTIPNEPMMQMSPRQRPYDESRRPSLPGGPRALGIRAPVPPYLTGSPRRYSSMGTPNSLGTAPYPPSPHRPSHHAHTGPLPPPPPPPPPPAGQHPLANTGSPPSNLSRRHTSADIRLSQSWEGRPPPLDQPPPPHYPGASPYASGQNSSMWPSSPRLSTNPGDQHIRDTLAQYELPRVSHQSSAAAAAGTSRSHSPIHHPDPSSAPSNNKSSFPPTTRPDDNNHTGWQLPAARYPPSTKGPASAAPTPPEFVRRSSMASNVHSLLNPTTSADSSTSATERDGERER